MAQSHLEVQTDVVVNRQVPLMTPHLLSMEKLKAALLTEGILAAITCIQEFQRLECGVTDTAEEILATTVPEIMAFSVAKRTTAANIVLDHMLSNYYGVPYPE